MYQFVDEDAAECVFTGAYCPMGTLVWDKYLTQDANSATSFFQAGRKTLADNYDYVMHGKLYKISEDSHMLKCMAFSFSGKFILLRLRTEFSDMFLHLCCYKIRSLENNFLPTFCTLMKPNIIFQTPIFLINPHNGYATRK
jgi:hypothetical protein